jgi:hypothetical protein
VSPWIVLPAAVALLMGAAALAARRVRLADERRAEAAWSRLAARAAPDGAAFAPAMIRDLPEPARRYLEFAITPGAPLRTVVELEMVGSFGLGDRRKPRWMRLCAREILAPPHGFVWLATIGRGLVRIAGSDAQLDTEAWTRFWLLGTVPLVRAAATPDLVRSARARTVGEALWAPASLLPRNGAVWEAIDDARARVGFDLGGERFSLDLTIAPDGRPTSFVMMRWSDANPEKRFHLQPFGGTILETGTFDGYTIPTRVELGNHVGTDAYFPFFVARVTGARYLGGT